MIPAIIAALRGVHYAPFLGGSMLISLLVTLVVFAIIFWLVKDYLAPLLPAPFGTLVIILLVIVAIIVLLGLVGIGPGIHALGMVAQALL